MYDKILKSILSDVKVIELSLVLSSMQESESDIMLLSKYAIGENEVSKLDCIAEDLAISKTVVEKLSKLVEFLQNLAQIKKKRDDVKCTENETIVNACTDAVNGEIREGFSCVETNSIGMEAEKKEVVTTSGIDTDDLIKLFAIMIRRHSKKNRMNWHVEYQYISSDLLRDPDNLIGVDGYAFVTLSQAINSITNEA